MATDEELFAEVTADQPAQAQEEQQQEQPAAEQVAAETQEEPQGGQLRDERGRFAPKPEDIENFGPNPALVGQTKPEQQEHRVPLVELLNEREKRQSYERQIEEERRQRQALERQIADFRRAQQPKPETPDVFENPKGFVETIEQTLDRKLREQAAEFSLKMAHRQYKGEFDAAYQALIQEGNANPATVQAIISQSDPGEALMQWHRQRSLMEKVGGDLDGYMKKREEELLKDPEFRKRFADLLRAEQTTSNAQNQRPAPVVQMPPSLSKVSPASPKGADDVTDVNDGEALFRYATRR